MKKVLVTLLLCLSLLITGCTSVAPGTGLVDSPEERQFRLAQIVDLQTMMITDDWDSFWLMDACSRLSYWDAHVGY